MKSIPTVEELDVGDWLTEDAKNLEQNRGELYTGLNKRLYESIEERKEKEERSAYTLLNGILFLSFVVPAVFAIILKLPMGLFYLFVVMWVHEAGHGFFCLLGNRVLCAFAGFMNEMLFTLVPAFICLRKREIYLAGCILIMCVGFSIQHTGEYMQSASNPYGQTSLAGSLTGRRGDMTEQSHDWSIIFRKLGVERDSKEIGGFTEKLGRATSIIFFTSTILAVIPISLGRQPKKITTLIAPGALVSLPYFILSGASSTEVTLSLILAIPLLKTIFL